MGNTFTILAIGSGHYRASNLNYSSIRTEPLFLSIAIG
jgi:hypothetical protein